MDQSLLGAGHQGCPAHNNGRLEYSFKIWLLVHRGVSISYRRKESVRSVFKTRTATRKAARPIQLSQTKAAPDTATGETGLKTATIGRNPVARTYCRARIA